MQNSIGKCWNLGDKGPVGYNTGNGVTADDQVLNRGSVEQLDVAASDDFGKDGRSKETSVL